MPAPHREAAALLDRVDALVAGRDQQLDDRVEARLGAELELDHRRPPADRRDPLHQRVGRDRHQPALGQRVQRQRALAHQVRGRLEAAAVCGAARRQVGDRGVRAGTAPPTRPARGRPRRRRPPPPGRAGRSCSRERHSAATSSGSIGGETRARSTPPAAIRANEATSSLSSRYGRASSAPAARRRSRVVGRAGRCDPRPSLMVVWRASSSEVHRCAVATSPRSSPWCCRCCCPPSPGPPPRLAPRSRTGMTRRSTRSSWSRSASR